MVDTAVIGRAVSVGVAVSPAEVGPYASTEAGLVDIDCGLRDGSAAATGIVLGSNGVAVTNNHVVAKAISIAATDLADGRRYPVVVLVRDASRDVAVIQLVGAAGLAVAPIGDSDQLKVGDPVTAIGNAGGRGGAPTVTTGEVTALGRSIISTDDYTHQHRHLRGMVEVSASVPSGDSGGALLGASGVVGMNTAAGPDSGFAIPINTVVAIARGVGAGSGAGAPRDLDALRALPTTP
jgi:S1-C subfamily serine protease